MSLDIPSGRQTLAALMILASVSCDEPPIIDQSVISDCHQEIYGDNDLAFYRALFDYAIKAGIDRDGALRWCFSSCVSYRTGVNNLECDENTLTCE